MKAKVGDLVMIITDNSNAALGKGSIGVIAEVKPYGQSDVRIHFKYKKNGTYIGENWIVPYTAFGEGLVILEPKELFEIILK